MSGISLTASMRSNLLSLQNIAGQQDIVQNRLATGLKVSSAIDNPSSYYTASSLNNRAADLTALLDAMSQGVQTIKAASEAIDSGTKFLEQAKAVASQALETAQPVIARVSSEAELLAAIDSDRQGLIVIDGNITLSENQTVKLRDGQSLVGTNYLNKNAARSSITLNINNSNQKGNGIEVGNNSLISDLDINMTSVDGHSPYFYGAVGAVAPETHATLQNLNIKTNSDYLCGIYIEGEQNNIEIKGKINIETTGLNACGIVNYSHEGKLDIANALINIKTEGQMGHGIAGRYGTVNIGGNSVVNVLSNGENSRIILSYIDSVININDAEINIKNTAATSAAFGCNSNSAINITAQAKLNIITDIFYRANNSGNMLNLQSGIRISYQTTAGTNQGIVSSINYQETNAGTFGMDILQKFSRLSDSADNLPDIDEEMKKILPDENQTDNKSAQYNLLLTQYDRLISDASYKGINLLDGQNLKINFNEDRSSKIDVAGVKADSESLGLKTKEWYSPEDIEKSIAELETAINSLRSFASEFGNYYSIVTTRQDFTENLINVLEEGADKLTLADMNQESANMLALQTSQQLAVNSLSLASQASQSILRLF